MTKVTPIVFLGCIAVSACQKQDNTLAAQEIERWNAAFAVQEEACRKGNPVACRTACQMSRNPTVCTDVGRTMDPNDPTAQSWVAQCIDKALADGQECCTLASKETAPAPPPPNPVDAPALQQAEENAEDAPSDTEVRGSLPREVIQRVMRQHTPRVKACYEQRLAANPTLSGRVDIKFIISGTGKVQMAAVSSTTLNDPEVEHCVAETVKRITFPAPEGGGIVIVTYPFKFVPAS